MKVIDFLNKHYNVVDGISKLKDDLFIKIREYPEDGIMILNYDMISSPKLDPIVRECRSLILENKPPFKIVSRSFRRFFNYLECPDTEKLNFNSSIVWEKLDGSIINLYFHNGKWNCSTRSMAFAEGETVQGYIYADIVKGVFDFSILDKIENAREKTFVCELVSPKTRVVKPYPKDDLYLLTVINKESDREEDVLTLKEISEKIGLKLPNYCMLNSFAEVEAFINSNCEAFDEGFVIADYSNPRKVHRIKMKNKAYLAIAHLRDNGVISPKRVALLVWKNDYDEYLKYFPEDRQFFEPFIEAFNKMMADKDALWDANKNVADQKEFALAVNKSPVQKILFQLRKGMVMEDIVNKLFDESKLNMLKAYIKFDDA